MPTFPPDPLTHARYALNVVANRLRRIEDLSRRMSIDGAPLSVQDYVARLKKRKKALSEQIKKAALPKKVAQGFVTRFVPLRPHFQQSPPAGPIMRAPWEGSMYPEIQTSRNIFGQKECHQIDGYQTPYGRGFEQFLDFIKHDSTYGYGVDDTFFETTGQVVFRQWLDDDASIWRDDTPDSYLFRFSVAWELPASDCAVRVICWIDAHHHIEFTNSTDDGGSFSTRVIMQPSDERGEFSEHGGGFGWPVLGDYDNQWRTGTYDGRVGVGVEFFAPQNAILRILLRHDIFLWAQDGLVEALGTIGTYNPDSLWTLTPQLKFSMVPIS